ncbi:FAD-dependent oxidoreductase [Paenibacillus humicola]|uniref:FAD-dependent oxidoreductase n=1 Tax=Paenibacillus humicola TaxID=3110540 RepID=UPI00237C04C1|nr:FAD-dependent oxidoreductase [Paenibacillus humicola]
MRFMRPSTRQKRDFVVETALKLFRERGFEQVSVDEIIHATGTSKGTFYHYFKSKDELLVELPRRQMDAARQWAQQRPSRVAFIQRHIERLFIDLGSVLEPMPKVVRSLIALQMEHDELRRQLTMLEAYVVTEIADWVGDRRKAMLLYTIYAGTVVGWATHGGSLSDALRMHLATAWDGLRGQNETTTNGDGSSGLPFIEEETKMKIAIIGGGLAGLTAAAYLSARPGVEGVLFERSPQLGGRAFTYEKAGFTLNYGAHAIYGIDRHTLSVMERELGLSFGSKQVDKRKVMYEKGDQVTPAPLDAINLVKTEVLTAAQKVRFVAEIAAVVANIHQVKNYATLGDYLAESGAGEDVKELWEHLVCSNFFITPEDARRVPGPVISAYYHNLFLSQRPVNYVLGSWAVITNQLRAKIDQSGRWTFALQEGVDGIRYENGKYILKTKSREEAFDRIVFAMPVQQVVKLLRGTPWEPFLEPYERNTPTEVMVYDVGFNRIVARPFSYISDMNNKMFISDVSATDHTLIPEGGQLLQGIAYLSDETHGGENGRKAYLEERTAQMEALFDRHYPGWRDAVAVKRVSKKAMVQSVKNVVGNRLLPSRIESMPFYFCGDGCEGKGELAERAFSSARRVAQLLAEELARV